MPNTAASSTYPKRRKTSGIASAGETKYRRANKIRATVFFEIKVYLPETESLTSGINV